MTSNTMTSTNSDKQIRHIYERWHEMIESRNLDGLMELYVEDSVLESTAILVLEKAATGVLQGKEAIRAPSKHSLTWSGRPKDSSGIVPVPYFPMANF
jgi:ketosteroid isomerase-like protein